MKEHLILVLAMVALLVATATGGTYSGGTGEPNDPYRIATAEDLNDIGKYEEDWDKHFILTNDVNLAEYTGTQFNIIGRWTDWDDPNNKPFTGIFDGNDNRIWNFTWTSGVRDGIGLFRYVGYYAQIKNLGMENANVDVGTIWRVGGLVAINWGGKITNCYSTGSISGDGYVGGLVGENYGVISDCYSTCDVSGGQVSGLVGGNWGTIINCYSTGSITGSGGNGGLVGYNGAGAITNCYSTGSVSGQGGVAGLVAENFAGTITNCYSRGNISGLDTVGGLVGGNSLGTITDCYSTGSVSGETQVGGMVGWNYGSVSNCYSTGSVSGNSGVGGLVGSNESGTISNSYSTGDVNGVEEVGGLVGWNVGSISNCYYTGYVNGGYFVGGLVGFNYGSVTKCYSTGNVNGEDRVGGLVGRNGETGRPYMFAGYIFNSYSTSNVQGASDFGGLVGCNECGDIQRSFWDVETSGEPNMCGFQSEYATGCDPNCGKTTAEMQTKSTFTEAGWDFVEIWLINDGATYPVLRQEIRSDLNGNGVVDFADFAIFAEHWLEGKGG